MIVNRTINRPYCDVTISIRDGDKDDEAVIDEMFGQNVYRLAAWQLSQDRPIVFDIGANIGAFTLLSLSIALEAGRPIDIYAVEPERQNRELLVKNIDQNPALLANGSTVTIISKALSNFIGSDTISEESGSSRIGSGDQPIDVTTLDAVLRGIDRVDFMKIDIEGSEIPLVSGAYKESLLKSHHYAIEFDQSNSTKDFLNIITPFLSDFSISTWGVPSRGCNIYLENHSWSKREDNDNS